MVYSSMIERKSLLSVLDRALTRNRMSCSSGRGSVARSRWRDNDWITSRSTTSISRTRPASQDSMSP